MESLEHSSPEKYHDHDHVQPAKRHSSKNNARRFTDEQIKSLESIFKFETKLEPRKKLELARDLGLEPRQVAIWFQNRRARWKSKQIEKEYRVLKANYDSLCLQFDELKREKQSLQIQLKELSDIVKNVNHDHKDNNSSDRDGEVLKEYPNSSNEGLIMEQNNHFINPYDCGDEKISKYFEKREDQELASFGEDDDEEEEISHLASPETWCNFIGQSSGTSTWW